MRLVQINDAFRGLLPPNGWGRDQSRTREPPFRASSVFVQQVAVGTMNVGTAHSEVNPNTRVMNSRGMWLSYILGIGLLHVVLLSIPFVSVPVVWTLTNLIHNLVSRHWAQLWDGIFYVCDRGENHLRCVSAVHVPAAAHGQRDAVRDAGPGEGAPAHPLGADGLRGPVYRFPQVPHHHAHRPVSLPAAFRAGFS